VIRRFGLVSLVSVVCQRAFAGFGVPLGGCWILDTKKKQWKMTTAVDFFLILDPENDQIC